MLLIAMIGVLFFMITIAGMRFGFFGPIGGSLSRQEAELRYPYLQLNRKEQRLYAALCKSISEYRETALLPGSFSKDVYERVYLLAAEQEPQFFYLDDIYETAETMGAVNLFYDTNKDDIKLMTAQMNLVADRILKRAEAAATDAEKLAVIHDEIAKNCEYSDGEHQNDAYGCLVDGYAKCEGYSKAFLYVARRAGLHVMNVTGKVRNGENHVWNIAEIDGAFYNIDVTWDDDDEFRGNVVHCCFAVPDSRFSDHAADPACYLPPQCTETTHSWYNTHELIAVSSSEIPTLIRKWTGDTDAIEFQCSNEITYQQVSKNIQAETGILNAVKDVSGAAGFRAVADETRRTIILIPA